MVKSLLLISGFSTVKLNTGSYFSPDMSMNMWCTGLLCFLLNPYMDWIENKSNNIVEIIPSEEAKHTNGQSIVSS